jgi:hypothetical protein
MNLKEYYKNRLQTQLNEGSVGLLPQIAGAVGTAVSGIKKLIRGGRDTPRTPGLYQTAERVAQARAQMGGNAETIQKNAPSLAMNQERDAALRAFDQSTKATRPYDIQRLLDKQKEHETNAKNITRFNNYHFDSPIPPTLRPPVGFNPTSSKR